ncbi:MAG: bifunctional [glutamate--ammonia ligase]-adenylyl-L-tyrosine phosphorylase/[glutamate--ammonia-ligase] adenylyltransferase [Methylococcales bacterium]|nr:bifunctional [glutamate--ammonia ligase]-adenylyl-L-tyrosine phosphorylase/[glutamate--ammonia-ligase] adenylyltransferase [Methylococcales bacterium]
MNTIESLPSILQSKTKQYWQELENAFKQNNLTLSDDEQWLLELIKTFSVSDFVAQNCIRHPIMFDELLNSGDLKKTYQVNHYQNSLQTETANHLNPAQLDKTLRLFRRREMIRIAWRDINNSAPLEEILNDLSLLAEACIDIAIEKHHQWLAKIWGNPTSEAGTEQRLVVLAMGKLGAYELNFSSDIDLIFAFPETGNTVGGREVSNQEFFIRLIQQVTLSLDKIDQNGFVFRVDTRLRPYGDSGPLVMSFDAMENYYVAVAREWERYAMIKARAIAGDKQQGEYFLKMLQPFIYRRYLDYGAFESIREMKGMINQEIKRKNMADNIKLGLGGIREIEFIGQAFQLIRGGRDPELRERKILVILNKLIEKNYLTHDIGQNLIAAYHFLRMAENKIQSHSDKQHHSLPKDDIGKIQLAYACNFPDWETFVTILQQHRQNVHDAFSEIISTDTQQSTKNDEIETVWSQLWNGLNPEDDIYNHLSQNGYRNAKQVLYRLQKFQQSSMVKALSKKGRSRLDTLMPKVLISLTHFEQPEIILYRVLDLLEKIVRRTSYLALLIENPMVLEQLTKLSAISPWITKLLSRYPLLLDELLDPKKLYSPPNETELKNELDILINTCDEDDLEFQMDILRQFAHTNMLRVAAAEITDVMPVQLASRHLANIAKVVLNSILTIAWNYMVKAYGTPQFTQDGKTLDAGFIIIAYGKLGGNELSYSSDLDLVFLYNGCGLQQFTSGSKSVDNSLFFSRLGQRVIHLLNTQTASGILYEVHMRLRPSGSSGLLVSNINAYLDYQQKEAWTWEHQALVRATPIAGSTELMAQFNDIRKTILCLKRDPQQLITDVKNMREKMRNELAVQQNDIFDLKQHKGGISDIEFIVQHAILASANEHPEIVEQTSMHDLLNHLTSINYLTEQESSQLDKAYRALRATLHKNTLEEKANIVSAEKFVQLRQNIIDIWQKLMET